jgi:hypothetical protein
MLNTDDEQHTREITRIEILRFARLLRQEVARQGMRADGALNQADFYETIEIATKRFIEGDLIVTVSHE